MNGLQRLSAVACAALTLGACGTDDMMTASAALAVAALVADIARPLAQLPAATTPTPAAAAPSVAAVVPPAPPVVSEYAVTQLLNNAETDLVQAREGWSYSVPELWAVTASRLDRVQRGLSEARTAIARAGTSSTRADDLDKQMLQVKSAIAADAPRAFAAYDLLGQRNFFAAFPVTIEASALFREHPDLTQYLGADNAHDARMLIAVYGGQLPNAKRAELEAVALNGPAEPVRPRPTERANDAGRAVAADAAGAAPAAPRPAPTRVLVDVAGAATRLAFPVSILPDDAQAVRRESERAFAEQINTAGDIIIAVSATSSRAQQRITSNEMVPSEFRAGVRQVPNQAYQSAEASVARAELAYQQALRAEAQNTSILFVSRLAAEVRAAASRLDAALAALGNTPRAIDEPVYQPYQYRRVQIEVVRTIAVAYLHIDRVAGDHSEGTAEIVQSATFVVVSQIHPLDRNGPPRGAVAERDVAAFSDSPASIQLSDVVRATAARPRRPTTDMAALQARVRAGLAAPAGPATAAAPAGAAPQYTVTRAADKRFDSVVIVNAGGLGTGFYVTDDIVLTNHHVIDGTQFVDLKLNSGEGTFGRVIASDPRLDLAIIRVQARGVPVTFYSETTLTAGAAVEAIGHPEGLYFSITKGVVSGLRLTADKPGAPVRYLQTDAALNPGNSGGPLFHGDRVVGVNTWGLPESQGLNFAVHYAEVFEFLARNQVTPRR